MEPSRRMRSRAKGCPQPPESERGRQDPPPAPPERAPHHTRTLSWDLWPPGCGRMNVCGLQPFLQQSCGGSPARGSPTSCAGATGSHPRPWSPGGLQCSASVQAETWFAVWTSAPMEGMPLGVSWRQKLLPLAAGKVYPASLRKSVLPEARARTLSRRDGFMRAGVGIFHFNGPVFIFMVTFYLWPWRWLPVTRDGALLPGLRDAPCGQSRH